MEIKFAEKDFFVLKALFSGVLTGFLAGIFAFNFFGLQELEKTVVLVQECSAEGEKQCFSNRLGEIWLVNLPFIQINQFLEAELVPLASSDKNFKFSLDVQISSGFKIIGSKEIYTDVWCREERCSKIQLFSITNTNYTEYSVAIKSNSLIPINSFEFHLWYKNHELLMITQCTIFCLLSFTLFVLVNFLTELRVPHLKVNNSIILQLLVMNLPQLIFDIGLLVEWRLLNLENSKEFQCFCRTQFITFIFLYSSYQLFTLDSNKYQQILFLIDLFLILFISLVFFQLFWIKLKNAESPFNDLKLSIESTLEEVSALQLMLNLKIIWTIYRIFSSFQCIQVEAVKQKVSFTAHFGLNLFIFFMIFNEMKSLNITPNKTSFFITIGLHVTLFTLQYLHPSNPYPFDSLPKNHHLN